MKNFVLVVCILCLSGSIYAQKVYDYSPTCQQAYTEIMKLKLEPGQKLINEARLQNPNNLIPDLLEGYIDFFVLFFNEDPKEYESRKNNFEKRIALFDDGPHKSPMYLYAKAIVYIQRACVRIKFGERYSAGWDFKKVNTLIKENKERYPAFQPNNMLYGPLQVAIGTIPKNYKWITSLFGMKGSISSGMQTMRNFLNSNDGYAKLFANEATFYYCYLMFYVENKPEEVFKYIQGRKLDVVNNHLFAYLAANLAINNKQGEYARNILQHKNSSPEYLRTPVWDFEMAYVHLHHLELEPAIQSFKSFINNFTGNFYVKDALQKISWAYYLSGNKQAAEEYRLLCIKKGNTETDADKKAYKDAKSGIWPNELLLKARVLNDGGYNKEALALLHGKSITDFPKPEDALEFAYRVARIYDELGKDEDAITYYQTAIKLGKTRSEYYAARAAVQIGNIYENRGQKAMAIQYYESCLAMEDHEYKDSLDQKAKAGIARCKGE